MVYLWLERETRPKSPRIMDLRGMNDLEDEGTAQEHPRSGLRKDKVFCASCNSRYDLIRHRIIPKQFYGNDDWDNIIVICKECKVIVDYIIELMLPNDKEGFTRCLMITEIEAARQDSLMKRLGVLERGMIPFNRIFIEGMIKNLALV